MELCSHFPFNEDTPSWESAANVAVSDIDPDGSVSALKALLRKIADLSDPLASYGNNSNGGNPPQHQRATFLSRFDVYQFLLASPSMFPLKWYKEFLFTRR